MIFLNNENFYVYSDGVQWSNNFCTVSSATSTLWVWGGFSSSIAIGDGTLNSRCSPVREFCSATDWCHIDVKSCLAVALKTSGQLWAWGANNCGQIGDGTTIDRCSPVREFCSATDWCQVSSGGSHTAAIKTSGELWTWGQSSQGQLGNGTTSNSCSPVREFCSATDWCYVEASNAVWAIKTNGQMWVWGSNSLGQLGTGASGNVCSPVREFCSATDWYQVKKGGAVIAIKTNGQLWGWGSNTFGVIGDGTTIARCSPVREFCSATDWCQVGPGNNHSTAVKFSGELWSWGCNFSGVLGNGLVGGNICSPIREFCSATDWCQVSGGSNFTSALKTNGQLWAWGSNSYGRLGDGTTTSRCSPVREFCSATDWCRVKSDNFTAAIKRSRGFNAI
jgi:alpha-tubulin suppressor-like RCC1 family protein